MKTFLLLVTWIIHDQPPNNYQISFTSVEACNAARLKVINDAERVRQETVERLKRAGQLHPGLTDLEIQAAIMNAPSISAV